MTLPEQLDAQHTLATAFGRYNDLRTRQALDPVPLEAREALELLALSEVIARKVGYGRQLDVRAARSAGASWSQVGDALGTSKQSAWETHQRWLDEQDGEYRRAQRSGVDDDDTAGSGRVGEGAFG
jgi:hypothetical protein